jgi:hypothetical protein
LRLRAQLLAAVLRHFDVGQRLSRRTRDYGWFEKHIMGETHDTINRFRCPRLGHHSVSTGNAGCAGSGAGHDHASRLWMRTGYDTGCRCLRGKNDQAPGPQVYSLDRRRLRRVALLLRGRTITARNVLRCGPFHVRHWPLAPVAPHTFAFDPKRIWPTPKADSLVSSGANCYHSVSEPRGRQ